MAVATDTLSLLGLRLHMAALGNDEDSVLLHRLGVDVDSPDSRGQTPLHVAALRGHKNVVRALLSIGARVDACCQFKWTPLHLAALAGHVDVIRLLHSAGANVETFDQYDWTPLNAAAKEGHDEVGKNGATTHGGAHNAFPLGREPVVATIDGERHRAQSAPVELFVASTHPSTGEPNRGGTPRCGPSSPMATQRGPH